MLIEAAWSYRFPARISREQLLRQEGLPKPIRDAAWKAQERLSRRYRKLARAGKSPTVVTTVIARELAGFAWQSPNTCSSPALDALRSMADITQGGHRRHHIHPKLSKAVGTVTARRTLDPTNSRISSDDPTLAARQRKLRDASPVRR